MISRTVYVYNFGNEFIEIEITTFPLGPEALGCVLVKEEEGRDETRETLKPVLERA